MRAPFQILVIPFRRTAAGLEFAVLKRSDADYWQFVAGGGEDGETPVQAAQRETKEEVGIVGDLTKLDSLATLPKDCFAAADSWGEDVYVIPQHCFAVTVPNVDIRLSPEHTEFQWVSYEQACRLLKWDSNRNALWELNQRLMNKGLETDCACGTAAQPRR
jgi:dATP pyrophosphohydrolase